MKMLKKMINSVSNYLSFLQYSVKEHIEKNGGRVGRGVFFGQDVLVDYDYAFLLEIGDGAVISARTIIELHDSCLPNVFGNGKNKIGRVNIGKRAYIGVNSVVLPGVTIGEKAIVGAQSLINKDVPSREVWAGSPIKYLCTIEELKEKRSECKEKHIAHFEWIGEIEKNNETYYEEKKKFIQQVRAWFEVEKGAK